MKSTTFVAQLPKEVQNRIYNALKDVLTPMELGYELELEALENAMSGRVCDLEEHITITESNGEYVITETKREYGYVCTSKTNEMDATFIFTTSVEHARKIFSDKTEVAEEDDYITYGIAKENEHGIIAPYEQLGFYNL